MPPPEVDDLAHMSGPDKPGAEGNHFGTFQNGGPSGGGTWRCPRAAPGRRPWITKRPSF